MENLIEAIRAATARDASRGAKRAGASACKAILAALSATDDAANENDAAALARVDLGELLDVALARLHVINTQRPRGQNARRARSSS